MADYSDYQKKIIRRYYDNRDENDEQKLAELVTNLYLSEGKKRAKLWEHARSYMERLGVPTTRLEHICKSADPALVAEVVKDLQAGKIKKPVKPPTPPGPTG